jgi:glycosyltransferase involved in cell wall biosynthesis
VGRILILANENSTIYNFRRELLYRLVTEKHEVVISLPHHERNIELKKIGCKIDEIELSRSGINPLKELALLYSYKKQIKRINPDVVLTYTAKPNIYGSLACHKLNIPYLNNVTGLGSMFQTENIIKKIMLALQKMAYKNSSCVFFQNESNQRYFIEKNIVGKNNRLLPGSGVNLNLHKFEDYPKDDGKIRFILVSRVRKDKGFDEMFEAIRKLSVQYKNIEFHMVGWYEDDNYKGKVDEMVKNYPVTYHGSQTQEQVHELIKECHCLIHPSYHEGMANVLLEAASSGRPVMASNIPGCRETFDEGVSGYGFEVKNAAALVNAIEKFIKLPYEDKKQMGIASRAKVEREFDRQIVIERYMEEINKLMCPRKAGL